MTRGECRSNIFSSDYPEEIRDNLTEQFLLDLGGIDIERVREGIKNIRRANFDPFHLEMVFARTQVLYEDAVDVIRKSMEVDQEVNQLDEAMKILADKERVLNLGMIAYLEKVPIEIAKKNSLNGKNAAEVRHSKPGGNREKGDAIRNAWATGKYSSRDICAEQECASLKMSLSSARKHLRNTPDPTKPLHGIGEPVRPTD